MAQVLKSSRRSRKGRYGLAAVASICLLTGCIHVFTATHIDDVAVVAEPTPIRSPMRAHLLDGSVVVYDSGAVVSRSAIEGDGKRFDALRTAPVNVTWISMDSVLGLESFTMETRNTTTVLASTFATLGIGVLAVGGVVAIACIADPKCFGSCPTVYTLSESGEMLEAELFSYSVAPLLEGRDVDLLGAAADATGRVELEIRNEALETHMINHLELLEVTHARGESVVPDSRGRPLILGARTTASTAHDRDRRDVRAALAHRDSLLFSSSDRRLAAASEDDLKDYIDLALPRPIDRDSIAVVLRLRNSLLNTVLFYDMMLGSAGAQALDWMGTDLQRIGPAITLGSWYTARMGMFVAVERDGHFKEITRVPDAGPIAWKDVAVLVPVPEDGDSMRIRLSFVTDEWRIDQVSIALDARRAETRTLPVDAILSLDATRMIEAEQRVRTPDEEYLETRPGTGFIVRFETGPQHDAGTRTFLLSSQGYYTEWIRPQWVRDASGTPFVSADATLVEAMRRWQDVKPEFERRFHETRIPVR